MICPSEYPLHKQNFAEKQVYDALSKLDVKEFDVFYNKSFALKVSKEAAFYEIDFLIFDLREERLNHIFVIEVKGGSIEYSSKRNQWSTNKIVMDKGPDEQVMGYVSNILERFRSKLINKVPVTWFLWFPDGVKGKAYLSSQLDLWRVLDQTSFQDPIKFLDEAIIQQQTLGRVFSGVDLDIYRDYIQSDLLQDFQISANLKNMLEEMNIQFEQIEAQQKLFFTCMLDVKRLAVEGVAGSGKSILAKCAATELADQNKKILLLCFNKHLKNKLADGLPENVQVNTIHTFMLDHIGAHDYAWFGAQNKRDAQLFDKTIPAKFREMLKKYPWKQEARYDAIIIDEAQDMQQDWLKQLMGLLRKQGQVIVFFDHLQNIFNKEFTLPEPKDWTPIRLLHNFRNSKKINDFINKTLDTKFVSGQVPTGKEVVVKSYLDKKELRTSLELLLKQLHLLQKIPLTDIKIIVDGSSKDWAQLEEDGNHSIPLRRMDAKEVAQPCIVYYNSIKSFKGCESDVVILVLDGPLDPVIDMSIRYTQISRAKSMLWVLEKKNYIN